MLPCRKGDGYRRCLPRLAERMVQTALSERQMKLFKLAKKFNNEEDGAVTVDWVVLTAAVVGLGVAALAAVKKGTGSLTTKINNYLSSQSINSTF